MPNAGPGLSRGVWMPCNECTEKRMVRFWNRRLQGLAVTQSLNEEFCGSLCEKGFLTDGEGFSSHRGLLSHSRLSSRVPAIEAAVFSTKHRFEFCKTAWQCEGEQILPNSDPEYAYAASSIKPADLSLSGECMSSLPVKTQRR